ncbi:MAG: RNA polymerase factor sigma-54, partial [candidate division Zixibacteria bacterium]|nr:RNA polymerase factor sigma-54 [candidate division Zixibacteria bacterium]
WRRAETAEPRTDFTPAREPSLYEHLLEQLSFTKLSDEDIHIGEFIIGNIDDSGYLSCPLEEIITILKCDPLKAKEVLELIQTFDPVGVGARDLRESLLIQLRQKNLTGTLAYKLVEENLQDLDKKGPAQLAKIYNADLQKVQDALDVIRTLSPKPAQGRFTAPALPVVPDLIVEKIGEDFVVYHNDKYIPRLRINATYRDMARRGSAVAGDAKSFIKEKLEQARWLLNSINQRRNTMIKVMQAIIEEQREFFESGPAHLKPLIMETIANRVGMNVATISRVSNDKYVQTPWGVFEIRHFFNAGIASQSGEDVSKKNVKEQIEEIIKKEDTSRPLSDQEIYQLLQKEGIKIARRTVTKYREESRILPARFRKKVAKKEVSADGSSQDRSAAEESGNGSSLDSEPAEETESLEDN